MASECGKMVYLPQRNSEAVAVVGPTPRHDRTTLEVAGMPSLPCEGCGRGFSSNYPHQRFCSVDCRLENHKRIFRSPERAVRIPTGAVGAIAELLVSADLVRKGYEVFRAVSPASSCDLVALLQGTATRVEVRTALRRTDGSIQVPAQARDKGRYDIMACLTYDNLITYFDADSCEVSI